MISDTQPFIGGVTNAVSERLRDCLRVNDRRLVDDYKRWFGAPVSLLKPSEWLEQSEIYLEIDATRGRERFEKRWTFIGREYLRESIDLIEDPDRLFLTLCGGTGIGKTLRDLGICMEQFINNPFSGIYVMPAQDGSGSASEISHEIASSLEASPAFAGRLPTGAARKVGLTRRRIEFGGNNITFVGANSTSKLGGKRCRIVFLGEQDKFKEALGHEASADYLAGERTKGMSNSLIVRSSSPSVEGRGIWKALMGGGDSSGSDCRRRFLNCPICDRRGAEAQSSEIYIDHLKPTPRNNNWHYDQGCHLFGKDIEALHEFAKRLGLKREWFHARAGKNSHYDLTSAKRSEAVKMGALESGTKEIIQIISSAPLRLCGKNFVLIKDAQYNTALPTKLPDGTQIPFAEMKWDKEARRKDGSWDMDRVISSTRFECPHCSGHVRDEHRLWMDKNGVWIPTRRGEKGHFGHQLSSFYAPLGRDEFGRVDFKSTWGGMAQKFLNSIENGTIGGYINSDLAEVNSSQNISSGRIEVSTTPLSQPDWIALLTADFHKNAPYIWFTVRKWCAFKLLPPVTLVDGKPDFVAELDLPGNEEAKRVCLELVTDSGRAAQWPPVASPAWYAVGELARFNSNDPATGRSPLIDFLLAQKITGDKLLKFFKETAGGDTMEFRRLILLAMWKQSGGDEKDFRAARGGDSELIAAGNIDNADCWAELKAIEEEFKIGQGLPANARATFIDSGYQDRFDAEVLRECYERANHFKHWLVDSPKHAPVTYGWWQKGQPETPRIQDRVSLPCAADGWLPLQGIPSFQPQGDGKLSHELSKRVADPFYGTGQNEKTRVIEVLRVPQMLFWKRRQDLRSRKTKNTWSISPNVSWWPKHYSVEGKRLDESRYTLEDYLKQSDGQYYDEKTRKVEPKAGRGGAQSKQNPYHVDDCDVYQVAGATLNEFFQVS